MDQLIAEPDESKRNAEGTRDLLRATLYSIGDAVMTTDREGVVQMMNAVAERLTGYAEGEARGQNIERIFQIVNEATRNGVENPVRQVLRDGHVVELANHTVLISKQGIATPIDDSGAPIIGSDGAVTGVVLVFRDVSERKRAYEIARRLAAIVENSDDAIVGKTLQGIVTSWNRGAERLFGYSASEMIGNPIARLIPPDHADEMGQILRRISEGESVDHYETQRLTKDGRRITVSLTVSPIRDEEGHIAGASKIARDISRERQLEENLRQAQKMEAVGRLAGGIAHDFNNLLTVILGYSTMARSRLSAEDPLHRAVVEVVRAAEQAASLTGQLLAFSRKQVTQLRILDLNSLVEGITDMLGRLIGEDIDLAVALEGASCLVKADAGQLSQVLMNLAANARDAMPRGGKLTIETHTVAGDRDALARSIDPASRYAVLVVTDTGSGMDLETQAHIFEPFFTTKESGKGTGLGLATVYGIVQQHGGWVQTSSELHQGTTFKIYLPAIDDASVDTVHGTAEPLKRRTGTILLVEDQAAIRMLAEDVLSEAGHRVLAAGAGPAALRLAEKCNDTIDLLITDVVMPEMSGPDLAAQLIRSRPGLTVLYISGFTDHALLHPGAIEAGTVFLQKPFLPAALLGKVDELLRANTNSSV
jgi:PAS domain S-box-containing protein